VLHTRTGKTVRLSAPSKLFASRRETIEVAYPGDIVGFVNPGAFSIGDTISTKKGLLYDGIPSFSPELFNFIRNANPSKRKNFQKGIDALREEGAVQVLMSLNDYEQAPPDPNSPHPTPESGGGCARGPRGTHNPRGARAGPAACGGRAAAVRGRGHAPRAGTAPPNTLSRSPTERGTSRAAPPKAGGARLRGAARITREARGQEYGVETSYEPLPYSVARWIEGGWPAAEPLMQAPPDPNSPHPTPESGGVRAWAARHA